MRLAKRTDKIFSCDLGRVGDRISKTLTVRPYKARSKRNLPGSLISVMSMPRFLFYCFAIPIVAAGFLLAFLTTPCHGFWCWCLAYFEPSLLMESFSFAIFLLLVIAVFFGPVISRLLQKR
jgi:hypothetical protein